MGTEQRQPTTAMLAGLICIVGGATWGLAVQPRPLRTSPIEMASAQTAHFSAVSTTPALASDVMVPAVAPVMISFRNGLLTVKSGGAPLSAVLAAITRSVGVSFALNSDGNEQFPIDLGPLPTRELLSQLLDRANYGYASIEAARGVERSRPARMFLLKQGMPAVATAAPATSVASGAAREKATREEPEVPPSPVDAAAALRQQRATDALFDACKSQGCDTS